MFRFLLFVLVVGGIALYFTNPSTDDVKAALNGQLPAQLSGATGVPADQFKVPEGAPSVPGMPAQVTDVVANEMQFERRDYYLFSVYKVSIGGQQTPGCLIGVAKQVVPYAQC